MVNYVVLIQNLAGFLMMKGFKLHTLEQSKKDMRRNVFIFTHSIELEEAIKEYKNLRK